MTTRRALLSNLVFVIFGIAAVFGILHRTDPDVIADKIETQPYAVIEIEPDGLQQTRIKDADGNLAWVLRYSTRVIMKRESCDEILIDRQLQQLGGSRSIAVNSVPSLPLAPVTATPVIVAGQEMHLPGPLLPGDYLMTVEVTCFRKNLLGMQTTVGAPAKTPPLCFRVPNDDGQLPVPMAMLPARCVEQLSSITVGGPEKLAMSRTWSR